MDRKHEGIGVSQEVARQLEDGGEEAHEDAEEDEEDAHAHEPDGDDRAGDVSALVFCEEASMGRVWRGAAVNSNV